MSQKPVITIENITNIALEERRPGCEKGMLHEDAPVQTAVYRVQPGSGVPTHQHARVYDLFVGLKGEVEIRYEGQQDSGVFVLKSGAFCRMPPGVRHEISNPSKTDEACFLLVQTSQEGFDYVPAPFRTIEAALPFSPRS
ncbi:MAG TPA: cupin domain-containing protein [Candidatus Binatia bacterium]|nr:cupin domain-containing protein [Candidatus Binatia bacterium]